MISIDEIIFTYLYLSRFIHWNLRHSKSYINNTYLKPFVQVQFLVYVLISPLWRILKRRAEEEGAFPNRTLNIYKRLSSLYLKSQFKPIFHYYSEMLSKKRKGNKMRNRAPPLPCRLPNKLGWLIHTSKWKPLQQFFPLKTSKVCPSD